MSQTHNSQPITKLEELRRTPGLAKRINDILATRFVFTEGIADVLASAIYAKQNVILYGEPGHGKSEIIELVLTELGLWSKQNPEQSETLIQSFGEGLTEDTLWGGIDFPRLQHPTAPELVYNVGNSFINYPVAVFEELFDAPAFCLLALKHALQSGFLAKNGKNYPVSTQLIIAATNIDPTTIEEKGPTYKALLERFVLQKEVTWPAYTTEHYAKLLQTRKDLVINNSDFRLLVHLVVECQKAGTTISPRTVMKAVDILIGTARGRTGLVEGNVTVVSNDFAQLRHVPGFAGTLDSFITTLEARKQEMELTETMDAMDVRLRAFTDKMDNKTVTRVMDCMLAAKQLMSLRDEITNLAVPDSLYTRKGNMLETAKAYTAAFQDYALTLTKV